MCGSAEGPTPEQLAHPPPDALGRLMFGLLVDALAESRRAHMALWTRECQDFADNYNQGKKPLIFPVRGGRSCLVLGDNERTLA